MSPTEYDADIFLKKILIFLASRIPASRFASLDHNCHIFWTQLLLLWNTTGASLDHNYHIFGSQPKLITGSPPYRVSQKKRNIRVLSSFCLICPATISLQSQAIFQMKGEINRYVFSTISFLSDIRELRYRQNNTGYQIINIVIFILIPYS